MNLNFKTKINGSMRANIWKKVHKFFHHFSFSQNRVSQHDSRFDIKQAIYLTTVKKSHTCNIIKNTEIIFYKYVIRIGFVVPRHIFHKLLIGVFSVLSTLSIKLSRPSFFRALCSCVYVHYNTKLLVTITWLCMCWQKGTERKGSQFEKSI